MSEIFKEAFGQIVEFLEYIEKTKDIKYYLVGGVLVNIYSIFRTTQDIDFVVDIESQDIAIEEYVSYLKGGNFDPMQDWDNAILLSKETNILQYFDQKNYVKFDNYIIQRANPNKYKKIGPIALKRRVRKELFNKKCWVESKEDFILSKLVFGGWQDYSDALGCWIRFESDLDVPYLQENSKFLHIEGEFELLSSGVSDPDEFFEKLRRNQ
ncbi:MAG: hypothetical protein EU544_05800 [Promethearchaeota archaeon]|nr:MAG: hypothetical protein EU544_05800 [Candidatus Lokiarchaeota archaeon]